MKLACVIVSVLSLFPSSIAFAPASLRTHPSQRTDTSLNSFLKNIFRDRSADREDQKKRIVDGFETDIKEGLSNIDIVAPTDEEDDNASQNGVTGTFRHMPTKEMTGVETHICRLCATMSQQCYELHDDAIDVFKLSTKEHETEAFITDKHDIFQTTNPVFGAAVCGETMILAWRGSNTVNDFINDAAFSPCASVAWKDHAKSLKIQAAMTSLAMNDIAMYEDTIIAECKKRGIKEIVTTGHSLGGGIGQCAHTIIRAQMQTKSNSWAELDGEVNIRSVIFAAPMTTVLIDNFSKETESFMEEIDANSCNLIHSNDVVPRGYGYLTFVQDLLRDCIPFLKKLAVEKSPVNGIVTRALLRRFQGFQERGTEAVTNNKNFQDNVLVCGEFVHPGKIVYYESHEAEPRVLTDMGFAYDGNAEDTLRSVKYKKEKGVNPLTHVTDWHMDIVQGPGIAYDSNLLH